MTLKWLKCEEDVSWDTNIACDIENEHSQIHIIKVLEVIFNLWGGGLQIKSPISRNLDHEGFKCIHINAKVLIPRWFFYLP